MVTFNKVHVSKTLTRILVYYLIVLLVSISLISIILYQKFSKATIEDIQKNTQDSLFQKMNQLEIIRNQVYALGLQLISDSDIVYAMYHGESDELTRYKVTNKLKQAGDSNPMIHSIYVYNSIGEFYIGSFGNSKEEAFAVEVEQLSNQYKDGVLYNFVPLTYSYKSKIGEEIKEGIVTSVFSESSEINFKEAEDGAVFQDSVVIINLKVEYLQKCFAALDSNSDIFLLSRNGDVICDSDLQNFGKNIANIDYIRDILASKKESEYFTRKENNHTYLVTFNASKKIPFVFVNKSKYAILLDKVHDLRFSIMMVFILIFILCGVLSILAAYNIYLPFDKLVKNVKRQLTDDEKKEREIKIYNELEYLSKSFTNVINKSNELELSIQESMPLVKKMFLRSLLEGSSSSLESVHKKIDDLKINTIKGKVCVLLFSIDGYSRLMTSYYYKAEIEKIVIEEIPDALTFESVDLEEDLTAFIFNIQDEKLFHTAMMMGINSMQNKISDKLGVTVTAAIGFAVDNIEKLNLSFSNCLELLKYRFVYGYNSVLYNDLIDASVNRNYPSIEKNTKKIIEAIKSCDTEKMQMEVNEAIILITDSQYDYIRLTINHLALDIMKAVEPLINTESYTMNFNNIFTNITNIDTLEDIKEWLVLFCRDIIQKLERKKDNKKKEMMEIVLSYIKANYLKPELSAEMLAERVNLSPGYFGKLFNEYAGKSVNEYIVQLRMDEAKELLAQSNLSVSDITTRVGFSNQSYFTATFKKLFGITPNLYRIESKKDEMTVQ